MPKLRVGVLMGGKSIEKEVSFNSGRTICDHLDTKRFDVVPLFQNHDGTLFILPWHFVHRGKISDFSHRLMTEAQKVSWDALKNLIDFMYIAVHGQFAEDGTLQGMLEILGIPYLGSGIFSSALCMDKIQQKIFLKHAGIKVPSDISLSAHEISQLNAQNIENVFVQLHEKNINLPYIVKPYKEGSSLGIQVVFENADLLDAIKKASSIHKEKIEPILIEEIIEGMEFSCIVLTDYHTGKPFALPPTEIEIEQNTHFYDYEQKYMPGRAHKFTPPRCAPHIIKKIQDTMIATMEALDMSTIARIDGFVDHNENVIIIDPNTLSGMAPASFLFREAAEINMGHTELINHLIDTELHKRGMEHLLALSQPETSMHEEKKLRVAVMFGGASNEREISLESGRNICYKLSPHKYEAIPLFVDNKMELYHLNQSQLVRNSTHEIATLLTDTQKVGWSEISSITDFVFIGLHGGLGENGGVQGALEMLGVPYNGSGVLTSALCMDKYKTNEFLATHGFEIPAHILISKESWEEKKDECLAKIVSTRAFPLIIKPHDDGCSVMVHKVRTHEQLAHALQTIFAEKKYALVEECVIGMELTVGVLGNENPYALPPSHTVTTSDILSIEEKFLPGAGENQTPAPLPALTLKFVQDTITAAYKKLDCKGYARIDCFYQSPEESPSKKERIVFIEVNTLPGMTPATCIFHQAAEIGMRPMDFIDQVIMLGMEHHKKNNHNVAYNTQNLTMSKEI